MRNDESNIAHPMHVAIFVCTSTEKVKKYKRRLGRFFPAGRAGAEVCSRRSGPRGPKTGRETQAPEQAS